MNWMTRWPGDYPVFVDRAEGARFCDVDGNVFVDFCLGRHRRHGGARAEGGGRRDRRAGRQGHHADAADRGRGVGRPRDGAAVRRAVLAVPPDRDRREPVRHPVGAPDHRPPEGRRAQLELPRVGRRDVRELDDDGDVSASRRATIGQAACRWTIPPGSSRSTTSRGSRRRSRTATSRRVPVRAGPDEHRHRAARPRLPRGRARPVHEVRHAPADRRDPHDQRRSRRVHEGLGPAARHRDDRQDARRGHPQRRVRHDARRSPTRVYEHTDWRNADVGGIGGTLAGNALSLAAMRATLGRGDDRRGVRTDGRPRRAVRGGRARA